MGTGLFAQATEVPSDEDSIPLYSADEEAATAPADEGLKAEGFKIPIQDYLKMILVLAGVIGAIYLVFYFLKKGIHRRLPENDLIKVISSRTLQGNSLLYLVEVGTNIFLVGAGDGKLELISEIKEKESLDTLRLAAAAASETGKKQPFYDIFSRIFKPAAGRQSNSRLTLQDRGTQPPAGVAAETESPVAFIKRQRDRLQNMR